MGQCRLGTAIGLGKRKLRFQNNHTLLENCSRVAFFPHPSMDQIDFWENYEWEIGML